MVTAAAGLPPSLLPLAVDEEEEEEEAVGRRFGRRRRRCVRVWFSSLAGFRKSYVR